ENSSFRGRCSTCRDELRRFLQHRSPAQRHRLRDTEGPTRRSTQRHLRAARPQARRRPRTARHQTPSRPCRRASQGRRPNYNSVVTLTSTTERKVQIRLNHYTFSQGDGMENDRSQLEAIANAFMPCGVALLKEKYDCLYRKKHHVKDG